MCTLILPFSSVFHAPELGRRIKSNNLGKGKYVFFVNRLLHLQSVFRVNRKNSTLEVGYHCTTLSSLGMIWNNRLMNPTKRVTNIATIKVSSLLTYDLCSLVCIIYHRIFGSPICNFDCQKINSLILFLYIISSISLKYLCFYIKLY